jgi:hypothetical protein
VLQGWYKNITIVLQECYEGVTRALPLTRPKMSTRLCNNEKKRSSFSRNDDTDSLPTWGVARVLLVCHKDVMRVLQECCKSVTRVLQECDKGAARVLQECCKSVTRVPLRSSERAIVGQHE